MNESPSYGTTTLPENTPLFGEASRRDRIINLVLGVFTSLLVVTTLVAAFVLPKGGSSHIRGANVYFAVCILLNCIPMIVLIIWYRLGDLEPKFRTLIYYMSFTMVLLCICAILFFNKVGD
ncbi:transmembrane protein 243 [Petromyzon marinus]|uniref:Transmembrane protein 243 n=1 Tax=Petromyzon marinus TaxID=7757 RepID=A0AAJ7TJL1_PETMA|nr:transmembrane protein 243 [Petromyzon marinus]XP_032819084.1 transmembrane protein 243 [Petromyzon marinus]